MGHGAAFNACASQQHAVTYLIRRLPWPLNIGQWLHEGAGVYVARRRAVLRLLHPFHHYNTLRSLPSRPLLSEHSTSTLAHGIWLSCRHYELSS